MMNFSSSLPEKSHLLSLCSSVWLLTMHKQRKILLKLSLACHANCVHRKCHVFAAFPLKSAVRKNGRKIKKNIKLTTKQNEVKMGSGGNKIHNYLNEESAKNEMNERNLSQQTARFKNTHTTHVDRGRKQNAMSDESKIDILLSRCTDEYVTM